MEPEQDVDVALLARTRRVPAIPGPAGDGGAAARRLDVALMAVGFKCSGGLLAHLAALEPGVVEAVSAPVLRAVRRLVGAHVTHTPYFRDFPRGVPDTEAFWASCIADALGDPAAAGTVAAQLGAGVVNLLDLPRYGRPQHAFAEVVAAHERFVPALGDRLGVLWLGDLPAAESHAGYRRLAESATPLGEQDLSLLWGLALRHVDDAQPTAVPMRESRAVVNAARLAHGRPLEVDAPHDVLRLACAMSHGDVGLVEPTRLRSPPRAHRRRLLEALDRVVRERPETLADVRRSAEPFKRLGERLHPHERPRLVGAAALFAVARGERAVRSTATRVDDAMTAGRPDDALLELEANPGALLRSFDRVARAGADPDAVRAATERAARRASTRVVLGLREHLLNRATAEPERLFVNRAGGAWATPDRRSPLPEGLIAATAAALDAEIADRLAGDGPVVIEPAARHLALPLSERGRPGGLGVLPRGSRQATDRHVRFFVHWRQSAQTTDFDLSALLLDGDLAPAGHVSWTNLREHGAVHSGDVVEAPHGASEFIDVDLDAVRAPYVIPQVHVYSGEGFDRVAEGFFGFMARRPEQRGLPFEPRSVRTASDLFGRGRVSLPLIFARGAAGGWTAVWAHLGLTGSPAHGDRVETSRVTTSTLARAVLSRRHLDVQYLAALLERRGVDVREAGAPPAPDVPVTYVGLDPPDGLPAGSSVVGPRDLATLLA